MLAIIEYWFILIYMINKLIQKANALKPLALGRGVGER
jgi:hypothetical protein